jgi:hypothetical protein
VVPQGRRPCPARAPVAPVLRLSAADRARIEALVSSLIDLLDAAAPDADAEPDFEAEAEADEASLQPASPHLAKIRTAPLVFTGARSLARQVAA